MNNSIPEAGAFLYRMTGYSIARLVSLFDTDISDPMFAQYERVTGRFWAGRGFPANRVGAINLGAITLHFRREMSYLDRAPGELRILDHVNWIYMTSCRKPPSKARGLSL